LRGWITLSVNVSIYESKSFVHVLSRPKAGVIDHEFHCKSYAASEDEKESGLV